MSGSSPKSGLQPSCDNHAAGGIVRPSVIDAVVVAHGDLGQVRRCVRGLRWSSVPVRRVVVVDTLGGVSPALSAMDSDHWLHVIDRHDNPGYGEAINVGIAATDAPYVLLANADVYVGCDALEHLIGHMQVENDVACVGPRFRHINGERQDGAFRFPGIVQAFIDAWPVPGWLRRGRLNGRISSDGGPVDIDHPLGACMLVRRLSFDAVDGFDSKYWMYSEEVDFCWRLKDAGWRVTHVPAAHVWHVGGASTRRQSSRMFVQLYRSRARWYRSCKRPVVARISLAAMRWGLRLQASSGFRARRPARDYRTAIEAIENT